MGLNIVFTAFILSSQHLWETDDILEDEDTGFSHEVLIVYFVLTIVLSTISITIRTLLIVGICTANYNFIFPTVLWIPALFIINTVGLAIFVLLDVFVQLCIVSLCWLFVNSYWQQVKIQRGAP